jgi:hypothetical protein
MELNLLDIPVMYVISGDGPPGAADAFKKIEDVLNLQLKGRKFYGARPGGGASGLCSKKCDGGFRKTWCANLDYSRWEVS